MVPWPWPLAPVSLAVLISLSALVLYQVYKHVIRGGETSTHLPILAGFTREVLPALIFLWAGFIIAYLVTQRSYFWTILPWATVTTIMLWPVGRHLKRSYLSYRSVGFIIGVVSMAYIPFAGFGLMADLSFGTKSAIFFGLVADLTVLGILPGLGWVIGKPIGMFFRPDLLFGDGRVLATGTLSLVLGMRYLIGSPAMGVAWPLPKWDWYAIFFAILAGLIPLIALRGITKLLMRLRRMRDGQWDGWGAIVIREGFLVLTVLSIGYGFHNAFLGAAPFTVPIFSSDPDFWPALGIVLAAAAFLIFLRGGYKRSIGDPFIKESAAQTFVKEIILVVGIVALFYGFMSILHMDPMHTKAGVNGLRTWSNMAKIWPVGIPLVAWGIIMLIPIRVLIQHYQRHAIVGQMAAVIIPNQRAEHRERLLQRMMVDGLLRIPFGPRRDYMTTMNRALAGADPEARAATTEAMVKVLSESSKEQRDIIMETQAAALGKLTSEERVTRMTDMMTAVAGLPDEKRRAIMEKMVTLLA